MTAVWFLTVEAMFLAATHFYGGPPWTLLAVLAFLAQIVVDRRVGPLAMLLPSLAWLALSRFTGNREIFFPFAMYLATHVALLLASHAPRLGWLGGGSIVAAFMVIRMLQAASFRVLAVELVVAAVILGAAMVARSLLVGRPAATAAIVALSSLAAYASLAL